MEQKPKYTGPGYSQEPGHTPLNKTGESANRWHPTADMMYKRNKDPRRILFGGYRWYFNAYPHR